MGVDLLLKMKGEVVADLGRAYHYEDWTTKKISVDMEDIHKQIDQYIDQIRSNILEKFDFESSMNILGKLIVEKDANVDELLSVRQDMREALETELYEMTHDMLMYGERRLLAKLLSESDLYVEKVY